MMNEKIYQKIYDEINKYLTPGWEKLVVHIEYGEASYSISFYEKKAGKYTKCFDFPGVKDSDLFDSFSKLDALISKERSKGSELWTNMTMVVDNKGDMHTDFDYSDLTEGAYEYKKKWKKKYLT